LRKRNLLLVFAGLLVVGTLAVAQTYEPSQSTALTPSAVTSTQPNGITMVQPTSDSEGQTDLNSPNFTHPDFRGTELEKAYQQEPRSGWQNPNITKSAPSDGSGGE